MNRKLLWLLAVLLLASIHLAEAQHVLNSMADGAPEMTIALPALTAATVTPAVPRAVDGIAEAYLALAREFLKRDGARR